MEDPLAKLKGENIDDLNDETFGDGAVEGDWEHTHYTMMGETPLDRGSPGLPTGHVPALVEVEQEVESMEQKIKKLWPSSPPQAESTGSIWSSPQLPTKTAVVPSLPPGTKVISLEEVERTITQCSSPLNCSSPSHHPPPLSPSSSHSPAHMMPPPSQMTPSPSHVTSGHMMPLPGVIQHHSLPHSQMPHPHFMMRGIPQRLPWLLPGHMPPPHHSMQHVIPRPNIPLLGHQMISPGNLPAIPLQPHLSPHPLLPGPFPPGHPFYYPHPDFAPRRSKRSEYLEEMRADGSGFMTLKEKEWVIKIQLVQLHSQDPDNEDYYYQNYKKRQVLRIHHSLSPSIGNSPEYDSSPSPSPSRTLPLPLITHKEYQPKEFQGALGKLVVSSIIAPRKVISISLGPEAGGKEVEDVARDSHKKKERLKQALIIIEKIFISVLALEDLDREAHLANVAEKEGDDMTDLLRQKHVMADKAFAFLRLKSNGETITKNNSAVLQLVMSYRKGKRVISRILPFLNNEQAFAVVQGVLRHLPAIIKKDSTDMVLPELSTSVTSMVSILSLSLLHHCLVALIDVLSPTSHLLRVCSNVFGRRVLLSILDCGHQRASVLTGKEDKPTVERWYEVVTKLHKILLPQEQQLVTKFPVEDDINLVEYIAQLI